MKTNLPIYLLTIFSVLLIFSCSDDAENNQEPDGTKDCSVQNFKFLKDGNELIYEFASLACLFDDRMKTSFIAEGENSFISTNECYLSTMEEVKTELSKVTTTECSGDIYVLDMAGEFMEENFRYKGERSTGDTWTHVDDNNVSATYTVIEKDVSIEVLEGIHICDKISYFQEGTINVDTLYFNNSVGFVKYDGLLLSYELLEKNF